MILIGNQRGGARDLANHLLKDENDHVHIHEISGFMSDNLHGALKEAYAISKGTKCKQFLFSLSLNPPADKEVSTQDFENAIAKVEDKLGLTGQPRAIVFHEKKSPNGPLRRHCHVVWSRIDANAMKAIHLPHSKRKLMDVSHDLFIQHGWEKDMPIGLLDKTKRDPRNFTLEEWQQAQRQGKDPRDTKRAIQDAWSISDNKHSFEQALSERGFMLARGKRAFVAVDMDGEVHSIPKQLRALKIKTKDVRAKLGHEDPLQSVEAAQAKIKKQMDATVERLKREPDKRIKEQERQFKTERQNLIEQQRKERKAFIQKLRARREKEVAARAARFRKDLAGLWDWIRGENARIRNENELDAKKSKLRDHNNFAALIILQVRQQQHLANDCTNHEKVLFNYRRT